MAIPFAMLLPLNNFFPGLAILFATIAQFEKDGLFIVLAIFWIVSQFYILVYFLWIILSWLRRYAAFTRMGSSVYQ